MSDAQQGVLKHALAMAERGYRVFPLPPNQKRPAPKGWQKRAANEPGAIRALFAEYPGWTNYGIATGNGLVVLDVDPAKGGGHSILKIEMNIAGDAVPDTFIVNTPSGGYHAYFNADADHRNTVSTIEPGLDTRSRGGFVLGPGSSIAGKPYTIATDLLNADAPAWLKAKLSERTQSESPESEDPEVILPEDVLRDRSRHYLQHDAPIAVEGQGGDHTTFVVACFLKDMGLPPPLAFEMMLAEWNEKCAPPWQADDLKVKVGNAFKYGENRQGSAAPEAAFDAVAPEVATLAETTKRRFRSKALSDLRPTLDKLWLIDRVLPEGRLALIAAKWNAGKTFCAIDMGMAITRNTAWMGRRTASGAVLYLAAEGDLANRTEAYCIHGGITGRKNIPFHVIEDDANLFGQDDISPLIEAANAIPDLKLIVIDTLAAVTPGADENSGRDMIKVMAHMRQIRRRTGATVLLIHHLGKDESKDARGHSSIMGAVDTAIRIKNGRVTIDKQRDGPKDFVAHFTLENVVIGQNTHGQAVTSCVVVRRQPNAEEAFTKPPLKPESRAAKGWGVLSDLTMAGDRVPLATWREEFLKRQYPKDRKVGQNAHYIAIEELTEKGYIRQEDEDVVVLP